MPQLNFEEFQSFLLLPQNKRGALMGIDYGEKNIGIAVSDLTRTIASPMPAVKRGKFSQTAAQIFESFDQKECVAIIMGHPLNLDGSSGAAAQAARAMARNLLQIRDVPLILVDERLSTSAVQRQMIDADITRKKRAQMVDSAAAAFVLQGLLDRLHY